MGGDAPRVPLREIAAVFLRLGLVAFGGPAAHVAMMEEEVVRRRGWLTHAEFLDLLGATNLIPGPNSTEMAIHLGRRVAEWKGFAVAGLCFILPAALIVTALAWCYVGRGVPRRGERGVGGPDGGRGRSTRPVGPGGCRDGCSGRRRGGIAVERAGELGLAGARRRSGGCSQGRGRQVMPSQGIPQPSRGRSAPHPQPLLACYPPHQPDVEVRGGRPDLPGVGPALHVVGVRLS